MTEKPFLSRKTALLLLCFLAIVPHLPVLFAPFFSDDYLHIERLSAISTLSRDTLLSALRSWILRAEDMGAWWTQPDLAVPYFRPLVTLSFLLDHTLYGQHPFGYHATNVLLHVLTTLLCFSIARRILPTLDGAYAAAALFAIHPCHTESVAWVSGRTDVIAGFFAALSIHAYMRQKEVRKAGAVVASFVLTGLQVGALLLGLCAKEMAITVPLILVGYEILCPELQSDQRKSLLSRLFSPGILLSFLLALSFLVARSAILGGMPLPPHPFAHRPGDPDFLWRLLTSLPLYLGDLVLFVQAEPVISYPFWMRNKLLLFAFVLVTLLILWGSIRESTDSKTARFSLFFVLLTLLPVLPVTVGERFLYLPSLGYVLLIGSKLPKLNRAALPGAFAILGVTLSVALGKGVLFAKMSYDSRRPIDDAITAYDQNPSVRRILVVDLPAVSSLAFVHAIRLSRPRAELQVEILSMTPHFLSSARPFRSVVEKTKDGLIVRSLETPYLGTYIEEAYLAERSPLRASEVVRRPGYEVHVREVEQGGRPVALREFSVHLTGPATETLFLRGHGFRLKLLEEGARP